MELVVIIAISTTKCITDSGPFDPTQYLNTATDPYIQFLYTQTLKKEIICLNSSRPFFKIP